MNHLETTANSAGTARFAETAGAAGTDVRARRAGKRRSLRAGSLLLGALMIPALTALPSAARDKGDKIQQRQSSRTPARNSSPPKTSSSPQTSSPPKTSSSAPRRQSSPPARSASPRRESPTRDSGGTSSPTAERRVYRDTHPGTQSGNTGGTSSAQPKGSAHRDAWRVRTWPTPVRTSPSDERYPNRRVEDRTYDGSRDANRDTTRSGRDHRGNNYSHNRYRNHRHHQYCGHGWGGYYDGYYGYGHYRYRGYYPWYWPWWPSVYIETDNYSANDGWGAIDLDVSPEKAEIYLDGQYIGVADEYDGFPSYLWLEKGTYDLAVYYEGYETIFRQVSIYPGIVIDVEDRMRRGESVHPDDYGPTSTARRDARIERNREKEDAARAAEDRAREVWTSDSPVASAGAKVGRLFISVLPPDSAVYLDGHFLGTAGEIGQLSAGMVVEPGDHVLELVRPGYETYRKELVVPPGERTTVEIELDRD